MRKILSIILAVLLISSVSFAQSIFTEDFSGDFFANGWYVEGLGQTNWSQSESSYAGGVAPEARLNWQDIFVGNSKLVTPVISTSAYTSLILAFNHMLDHYEDDMLIAIETTSNGTTWNEVWSTFVTGDIEAETVFLNIENADVGSDNFQIAFTYDGQSYNLFNWCIDDVILNNKLTNDVAAIESSLPALLSAGNVISPIGKVINFGYTTATFDVTLDISENGTSVYSEIQTVTDLANLDETEVTFPDWTSYVGVFDVTLTTSLSGDENPDNDVITELVQVANELYDKKPLFEIFTTSTWGQEGDFVVDAVLANNPDAYTLIKYQMNWPGAGDPYYTEEAGYRGEYYNFWVVPNLYVDAVEYYPCTDYTQELFDESQGKETGLEIEITQATIDDDNIITISTDLLTKVNYSAGLSAHIVVIEMTTHQNPGGAWPNEYYNTMMKMLPDDHGTSLDDLVSGVPTTLAYSYDMDITFMEEPDDLAVVVFVQDDIDKSVLQSAMIDVTVVGSSGPLFTEYFNCDTIPDHGWSFVWEGSPAVLEPLNWDIRQSEEAGGTVPEAGMYWLDSFNGNLKMVSPDISTSGYTSLILAFNHILDHYENDMLIAVETTSNGTTWNEVWSTFVTGDIEAETVFLNIENADVGSDNFQIAFTYDGQSYNLFNWCIDDVILNNKLTNDVTAIESSIPALLSAGNVISPIGKVLNLGSAPATFEVTLDISENGTSVYSEIQTVTDLANLDEAEVTFPDWTSYVGVFDVTLTTSLSSDENPENDVITELVQVADELYAKKPLFELFTSSTCGPCVPGNEVVDAVLADNPDAYTIIKYPMNWPGIGDPYYTEEAGYRGDYYDLWVVPYLYVDAVEYFPCTDYTQELFDESQGKETGLGIEITQAIIDNDNIITISTDLLTKVKYSAGLSAHIVIVEKLTTENYGTGGGPYEFYNQMMKMLPDSLGTSLDDLVTGVPTTLTYSYDMDLTFMETNDDLAVIVFVQDDIDKSVLQSDMIDVTVNDYCTNFDALTVGGLVAEQLGGMWTTWSGTSADDATVSDIYSYSPDNSFVVDAGTVDLVRKFDDVAIEDGQWLYSNYIYVPTGFSGYFNVQSDPAPGVAWVVDLFFDDGGTGSFGTSATSTFEYEQDSWILVEINFDLDADFAEIYFDGALMTVFAWDGTIGGIDYYGYDVGGTPGAYYDDVCFEEGWIYTSIEEQLANTLQLYPNPATDLVKITSDYTMESVTVYNFAGQVILTESVNSTTYRINTSNFDSGIYLFQIETEEGRIAKRIIIE